MGGSGDKEGLPEDEERGPGLVDGVRAAGKGGWASPACLFCTPCITAGHLLPCRCHLQRSPGWAVTRAVPLCLPP